MSEQNVNHHISEANQNLELMHSSEGIRELDGDELSGVSGAGFKEAIVAYSHAGKLGGSLSARLSSFMRGLKFKDDKDATARATRIVKAEKKHQEFQKRTQERIQEQKKRQQASFQK